MKDNNIYYCKELDCTNIIHKDTFHKGLGRCRSCSKKGKLSTNYKDGITLKKAYCQDCGKELCKNAAYYGYKRCNKCEKINRRKPSYCIDCGKKISLISKRCKTCYGKIHSKKMTGKGNHQYGKNMPDKIKAKISKANKGRKVSKAGRRKMSLAKGGTGVPYENKEYPYDFYRARKYIRNRDDYTCQNCGMVEEEHLIVYGKNLEVHHIDYNKHNCDEHNLITVCKPCNIRANFNRDYWQNLYKNKIKQILKK